MIGPRQLDDTFWERADAAIDTAEVKLREVGKTLEIYYSQNFNYPETLDELVSPEEEGKEAVLKASALMDPWKNELQYVPTPGEDPPFELISFGPDGMEGSEDDLDYHALDDLEGEDM